VSDFDVLAKMLDALSDDELDIVEQHIRRIRSQRRSQMPAPVETSGSVRVGIIADMHGDFTGFQNALAIFDRAGVNDILCAGDIVDRGPEADEMVKIIRERGIPCIKGNHDHTVLENQAKWRSTDKPDRLRELGRIISDDTADFLRDLPENLRFEIAGVRLIMGHGTPTSDVLGIFPTTRQGIVNSMVERYGADTDVMILGHTHQPMKMRAGKMWIFNPGSIYGITIRDSHTCAILSLPECEFTVFDVRTGEVVDIPLTER
jgi:putative phosphoesterase